MVHNGATMSQKGGKQGIKMNIKHMKVNVQK